MKKKSVLIILAENDFNEFEYSTAKDTFKRAGFQLFICSDTVNLCVGSNGLKVKPDIGLYNVHPSNFDSLVIIGGNGIRSYWDNRLLHNIIKKFHLKRKIIGAICSSPVILARAGVLNGIDATCFPDDAGQFGKLGIKYLDDPVVEHNHFITAQCPENSTLFSERLVNLINNSTF